MIKPAAGSIWTPIIRTMKSLRPVNRYFASATAARKASAMAINTVTITTITLFFTSAQKNGRWIASVKWRIVGVDENQVGLKLLIWSSVLNAVDTIQKTGKTITTKSATPAV